MPKAGDPSAQWACDPKATFRTMTHSKDKAPDPCPAAGHYQTLDPQAEKGCGTKCPVWSSRECGPAWSWRVCTGLSLLPSEAPRAHEGSEQLPWGAAPAGMMQCGVQSQWCLNQTTMIVGVGWFPILGLISLIPAPKVMMCCFPGHPQPKAPSLGGTVEQGCSSGEQRLGK